MTAARWISKRASTGRRLVAQRASGDGAPPRPFFIVCGDDPLAHRLVDELITRYGAQVTVILRSRRRNHGPRLAAMAGVRVIEARQLDEDAFRVAKLARADGLALVQQDEVGNIHAALRAQEIHPGLRLVIRMFNMSLGYQVRRMFRDCVVLSDASIAAPEFVAAALGEVARPFVRLSGRTLFVARRADVPGDDVVCGIATLAEAGESQVLPADGKGTDLVLAVARGKVAPPPPEGEDAAATRRAYRRARRRRPVLALSRALFSLVDSKLEIAVLILVLIFVGGVVAIGLLDRMTPWQALYTTVITAADAGDPDPEWGLVRQVTQAAVAVAGIAMVPVLTAVIINTAVNARLATVMGQLNQPMSGHVVVIGLGNVGTRVIRQLHELGHDVVAIDRSETARGVLLARELDIPLIIGDASQEETLRQASVHTCRALLALSTSDVTNLEAALHARRVRPGMRVVMRLFDDDFARRVEQDFKLPISRSVSSLAAPAFAAALLEREVRQTIAVGRQVLVIAEVPIAAGSGLDGARVSDLTQVGEVSVIAVSKKDHADPTWTPAADAPLGDGDQLIVIASKIGLSNVLARSAPAPDPPPVESTTPGN